MPELNALQFALRLLAALAMGAAVGLERQWRQRMAGTRTNALVATGASAFVMCGFLLTKDDAALGRIVSYVVSGVGFLGAGVIFKDSANVRGLNTAATIWCSAAIGALCGLGSAELALLVAIAVLGANLILRPLAYRLHPVLPEARLPRPSMKSGSPARSPSRRISEPCSCPPSLGFQSSCRPSTASRTTPKM